MKTPSIIVIISSGLALLLLGLFVCVMVAAAQLGHYLQGRIKLHVYMQQELSPAQLAASQEQMQTKLAAIDPAGGMQFVFVSKEQAAIDFRKSTGEDFVAFLGTNPLRDYYEVTFSPQTNTPENLEKAKRALAQLPDVFEVTYLQSLAQSLAKNIQTGALVLAGMSILLGLAASALVSNTISLSLFSKRFLVRSMQLVGARPSFVLRPFVGQGAWLTGLGGLFASIILVGLYFFALQSVPELGQFLSLPYLSIICGCVILAGATLGAATSYLTLRRYLRLSLDKLA